MDYSFFRAAIRFTLSDAYLLFPIIAFGLMGFYFSKLSFCLFSSHTSQTPFTWGLGPYFGLVRSPLARPRGFIRASAREITYLPTQISRDLGWFPFLKSLAWFSAIFLILRLFSRFSLFSPYLKSALEPLSAFRGHGWGLELPSGWSITVFKCIPLQLFLEHFMVLPPFEAGSVLFFSASSDKAVGTLSLFPGFRSFRVLALLVGGSCGSVILGDFAASQEEWP